MSSRSVKRQAAASTRVLVAALGCVCACRRHTVAPVVVQDLTGHAPPAAAPEPEEVVAPSSQDLLPGDLGAFGLTMPVGTTVRLESPGARMYYVDAAMPRVMRYLQRRLVFHDADIHPLGAMIRGARPSDPTAPSTFVVDVGVRDEGDRTLVSVWNRTPAATPARSVEDGLRAAGVDPATGQPMPQYNN